MTLIVSAAPVLDPRDLGEALALRAAHPEAMPLAGGTDVMVYLEGGAIDPPRFLNLWGLTELGGITRTGDGLRIGALATHTDIVRNPDAQALAPALVEACRTVGAVQIQNRGTLGGNIVNASPAGDTLPVLLALDARFELHSAARGARRVPAATFWQGYRRMDLAPDELLVAVHLPSPASGDRTHFRKVGTRQAQSISKVVLGARVRFDGEVVTEARVAFGSVAATPVRCPLTEAALVGRRHSDLASVADTVAMEIRPIDDVRSTAEYRLDVAVRVLRAWLLGVA
jgi:CO/xanthine dehydrogenase FAD-binding subunit